MLETPLQSGVFGIISILFLLIPLVAIAAMWKVFTKAGKPGWAAIVPIYNIYILIKITGNETWWLILFLIPVVNFLAGIKIHIDLAKQFGQGMGFGLGLSFLPIIFYPLLGFGSYQYQGSTTAV